MKDEDDGWRYVISSKNRYIKGDITTWGKIYNNEKNKIQVSKPNNINISKVIESIYSLISIIKSSNFYQFLIDILYKNDLKKLKIIVLGCASPTAGPFITNCKYQWALIKLLLIDNIFKVTSIEIYDPIMNEIDYQIWNQFIEFPKTKLKSDLTFLIMPHCEAELYRTVIESLSHKLDIIESAKQLANGEYVSRDILEFDNVIMLSNTLINCKELNLTDIVETRLPKFDYYPNAFNDLYMITKL